MNQVLQYGLRDSHPDAPPSGYAAVYVLESDNEVYRQLPDGTTKKISASGGALSDAGSDNADGGDQYQLPQAEDSIDLQSSGDIENAASISTDDQTISNSVTYPDGTKVTNSPGGLSELIESKSLSSASSADFTTGIDSDHNIYIFYLSGVTPATDGDDLFIRVSSDGGSTWESGASAYDRAVQFAVADASSGSSTSTGASEIQLTAGNGVGNSAGEPGLGGTIKLINPAESATYPLFRVSCAAHDNGPDYATWSGGGSYKTAEAIDGVRFLFESGNIQSGKIELVGFN